MQSLLAALARIGVRQAVVSFLFLRWGIKFPLDLAWGDWSARAMRRRYTLKVTDYCGGGTIWLPPLAYRLERIQLLQKIAAENGITIKICRCKNSDLPEAQCCHPLPSEPETIDPDPQLTLF